MNAQEAAIQIIRIKDELENISDCLIDTNDSDAERAADFVDLSIENLQSAAECFD